MKLVIDASEITVGDLMQLEQGGTSARWAAGFLARFATDESTGEKLPMREAVEAVKALKLPELRAAIKQVYQALNESAVNPTTGGS